MCRKRASDILPKLFRANALQNLLFESPVSYTQGTRDGACIRWFCLTLDKTRHRSLVVGVVYSMTTDSFI
jgi:hypothetical protein